MALRTTKKSLGIAKKSRLMEKRSRRAFFSFYLMFVCVMTKSCVKIDVGPISG